MRIYTVLSYSYSGEDNDVYVETYKSFKSQEAASQYLLKISKKCYDDYYDDEEYDYTCGERWAQISNEQHNNDPYYTWYRYYQIIPNDLCEEDTLILNT